MRLLRIFPLVLILVGAALLFERPAYAYVDPGSGLLAVQAAGSALVATGWFLRRKIYALFHRGEAARREPANHETEALRGANEGEDPPRP